MNKRVLPGRITIVLTRDETYPKEDNDRVLIMHSVSEVVEWYNNQERDLYIIGGSEMFLLFENELSALYKTVVHGEFAGDTYFLIRLIFEVCESVSGLSQKDAQNPYDFTVENMSGRRNKSRDKIYFGLFTAVYAQSV